MLRVLVIRLWERKREERNFVNLMNHESPKSRFTTAGNHTHFHLQGPSTQFMVQIVREKRHHSTARSHDDDWIGVTPSLLPENGSPIDDSASFSSKDKVQYDAMRRHDFEILSPSLRLEGRKGF